MSILIPFFYFLFQTLQFGMLTFAVVVDKVLDAVFITSTAIMSHRSPSPPPREVQRTLQSDMNRLSEEK